MTEWVLKRNQKYKVTVGLRLFESFAPNWLLGNKFTGHGFESVEVTGEGKNRTMFGTWGHDDTSFFDDHITNVEPIND